MANKVGKLAVVITAGTSGLSAGLRRGTTAIDKFVGTSGKAAMFLGTKVRPGINATGAAFAAMGAAASASAIATALAIKGGADRIDDLADSSKRLLGNNGATGALAGLRFAAEEAGVEAGGLDKGLGKLLDTISRANRGDKGAIQAFQRIGLDAQKLQQLRPEDRMIAVADALGRVSDAGDKISLSKGIFGKAGEGLVPLFNEGGDAIRAATKDMELFGHAINGLDAEKVGTMNDQIGRLKLAWEGVTMQLAVQFAPLVTDISERLMGLIENTGGVGKATDKAFGAAVNFTRDALDAAEELNIGWLKFKRTLSGILIILNDISSIVTKPAEKVAEWLQGDETERRLQMIAPGKREEFKRRLEEAGGFQSEGLNFRGGLMDENRAIQQEIADAEKRRAEKGSLGDRFVAWEQAAQTKGAASAAAKLEEMADKRLSAESAVTKELEKQTAEKREQQRMEAGGQGKFGLMAFNGAGSRAPRKGRTAEAGAALKSVMPAAAMHAGAVADGPAGMPGATGSAQGGAPVPRGAAPGSFGTKEYWDQQLFGGAPAAQGGAPSYADWKAGRKPDPNLPKYMSKIPDGRKDYLDHVPMGEANYKSKIPTGQPKYLEKMGDSMTGALNGDPVAKALAKDQEKTDKMIALLERIAGNTKGPTVGALA